MNGDRDKRLAKLERRRRPRVRTLIVWLQDPKQDVEEAIARSFPKGVPAGARLVICRWRGEDERSPATRG